DRRKRTLRARPRTPLLADQPRDGLRVQDPPRPRVLELLRCARGPREAACTPILLRAPPLRLEQAVALEPVERRIEGSFLDLESVPGSVDDPPHDGQAVERPARDGTEHQEVEGAVEGGRVDAGRHDLVIPSGAI